MSDIDPFLYFIIFYLFFYNAPAPTDIYTLSLHDALPIWLNSMVRRPSPMTIGVIGVSLAGVFIPPMLDRKSTRLNSSHRTISYAVFCLKKKKNKNVII